jgi:hypothetical protein
MPPHWAEGVDANEGGMVAERGEAVHLVPVTEDPQPREVRGAVDRVPRERGHGGANDQRDPLVLARLEIHVFDRRVDPQHVPGGRHGQRDGPVRGERALDEAEPELEPALVEVALAPVQRPDPEGRGSEHPDQPRRRRAEGTAGALDASSLIFASDPFGRLGDRGAFVLVRANNAEVVNRPVHLLSSLRTRSCVSERRRERRQHLGVAQVASPESRDGAAEGCCPAIRPPTGRGP